MESNNIVSSEVSERLIVVSYNLHGLNQGKVVLNDLVASISPDIFMVQEHWLTMDNLYKLNEISPNYTVFSSSAMNKLWSTCW
jgi:exonuclease III